MGVAEAIVICIDATFWMSPQRFQMQCDIIEHYCEAKFDAHQDTVVGLVTVGSLSARHLLSPPTGSLTEILDCCKKISPTYDELNLLRALTSARLPLAPWLRLPDKNTRDKNTRILFFVGGPINLTSGYAEEFGEIFSDTGVAVDVVTFCPLDETLEIYDIDCQYGRSALDAFVNICNSNTNSHIVDVGPESSICEVISYLMSEKTPCVTEKGNDNVRELELSCKKEAFVDDETWISYLK